MSIQNRLRNKQLIEAINVASCGITIADARSREMPLVYVNHCFEEMTGYLSEEILGTNCRFLQGDKINQPGLDTIRQSLKAKKPCQVEILNYKKNGELFYNELRLAPLKDENGKVSHYIGVQTDITERIQLTEKLLQHQGQLEELVDDRTKELNEKNTTLKVLLGQVELERNSTMETIATNVDSLIIPLLKRLKLRVKETDALFIDSIEKQLTDLTEPFGKQISRKLYNLSPREIEVCTLIAQGMRTKEIAKFFNVSISTIENQRNTIRHKLGINKQDINLVNYLQSLV